MAQVLVNLNNVTHSPTQTYNKVAFTGAYTPRFDRYDYVSNWQSSIRYRPLTFDEAGTLKGLVVGLYLYYSHWEHPDDEAELNCILQENVGGTWTDRATAVINSRDYYPSQPYFHFKDFVYAEFDTPYTIDTAPNKWRFKFVTTKIAGNDTRYMYLLKTTSGSFDDNGVVLPVLQATATLDTDGLLVNFGQFVIDAPTDFEGHDIGSKGWSGLDNTNRRVAIYNGATKLTDPHPKIIVTENAGMVRFGGMIGLSASNEKHEHSFYVVKDENNLDQPVTKNVDIRGYQHSSAYRGLFSTYNTGRGYGFYRGIKMLGEFDKDEFMPLMTNSVLTGATQIKVRGDYTTRWNVGDDIYITSPVYSNNLSYADWNRHEKRTISAMSYDAGADETTITVSSAFSRAYDFNVYNNLSNATANANIDPNDWERYVVNLNSRSKINLRADDGDYSYSSVNSRKMYNVLYDAILHLDGVTIEDFEYLRNDMAFGSRASAQYFQDTLYKNILQRGVRAVVFSRFSKDFTIENIYTLLKWYGSTKYQAYRSIQLEYSKRVNIKNIYISSVGYLYMPYSTDIDIDGIYGEADYIFYLSAGNKRITINNLRAVTTRRVVTFGQGAGDCDLYNAEVLFAMYYSNYNENTDNYGGLTFVGTDTTTSGKVNFYSPKIGTAHDLVNIYAGASADIYIKDLTYTGHIFRKMSTFQDRHKQMADGSIIAFENYNGEGKKEAYTTNGYILATDDGNGGIDWELSPYDSSSEMIYLQNNSFATVVGEGLAVIATIKIENADFYSGNHTLPTLKIAGLGMTQATTTSQALPHTDWQQIVVSGVPTEAGFFDISLSFQTDSPENKVLLRSIKVVPPKYRDTASLNITSRAMAQQTIVTELNSASDVWNMPTNQFTQAGTFGKVVGLTHKWVGWLRSLL